MSKSMKLPTMVAPTYELKLPSSGEKVTYRPFLVKEEKILDDGSFRLALEITKQDIYRFLKKEGMSTNAFVKM